jgi:MoaA/NifB/PqqE/SkfB family radical SAM enzyme
MNGQTQEMTRSFALPPQAHGRPLYIWGAGNQGRGLYRALERQGVAISGFIDSSAALQGTFDNGRTIVAPSKVLNTGYAPDRRPFIIIASFFFEEQIAEQCAQSGLMRGADFIPYTAIKPHDYAVDISGVCNLRCLSCPRAQKNDRHPHEGFMTPETFERVVDKIIREDPLAGSLQLYQWGEPLLNPAVAEIITIAKSKGMLSAVSSNLNNGRNLEAAVKAGPAWFRLSVSGWGTNYELTHTGGNWDTFHRNFLRLAELRRSYNPDMKTEVYYHLYKHNQGDDAVLAKKLCDDAGFEFHPVYAYLISLDDVLEHLEGKPLPEAAQKAESMLALPLEQGMKQARAEATRECLTLRCVHVNWDLSVSNCMMYYNVENNRATSNFLDTPLKQINGTRSSCSLCRRCRKHAMHRYCSVYSTTPALTGADR